MRKVFFILFYLLSSVVFIFSNEEERIHVCEPSYNILLANKGKALLSVTTSPKADIRVKSSAVVLSDILSKIANTSFVVKTDNGKKGIAVGVINDFPNIPFKPSFNLANPAHKQGYEIKSHKNGIYIIGATPLAVEYAVYDFLQRLGYRQYFPMKKWEIIPYRERLEFSAQIREIPDYYTRYVWPGFGFWPEFINSSKHWNIVNKNGGYILNTGHAYDDIVKAYKNEFEKHPEYYSLVNGKRRIVGQEVKFCTSNQGLQNLIVEHVLTLFANTPYLESVSLDPSDGGGWCECNQCLNLGTPSTRAVYLANLAAKAVREKFEGKRIGIYAYNMHSPPPEIDVDQDVVVSVATNFIAKGMKLNDVLAGWEKKKAVLGIREYYDVYIWSKMLPGRSLGSNINYLKITIPKFYQRGARYLTSEASDDWGANGLGYYIANKILWNFDESDNISDIIDDFCLNVFGPSAEAMKEFYTFLDGSEPKMLTSDLVGRMYRQLNKAIKLADGNELILSRIYDLVLYTRYVELFKNYEVANGLAKEKAFNNLMNFVNGIKKYRIIHTLAIQEGEHWKNLSPNKNNYIIPNWFDVNYTSADIIEIVNNGILNNDLLDFVPIGFSEKLLPVQKLATSNKPLGNLAARRGKWSYYTWVNKELEPIKLEITGGMIPHYRNRGNVIVSLFKLGGASEDGTYETLIHSDTTTVPNGKINLVSLMPNQEGLHLISISDGMDMTNDKWINYNKIFTSDVELDGTFYFYVPKNTVKLGMYHKLLRGKLYNSSDEEIFEFNNTSDFQSFPVGEQEKGKIWYFKNAKGIINLMTVPSYFSLNPNYLLLPEEVILSDEL